MRYRRNNSSEVHQWSYIDPVDLVVPEGVYCCNRMMMMDYKLDVPLELYSMDYELALQYVAQLMDYELALP